MPLYYVAFKSGALREADGVEDAAAQVRNELADAGLDASLQMEVTEVPS